MKYATFVCTNDTCNWTDERLFEQTEKIPLYVKCQKCGVEAHRTFNNISIDKESENTSAAIQTILYSSLPSGRAKAVY